MARNLEGLDNPVFFGNKINSNCFEIDENGKTKYHGNAQLYVDVFDDLFNHVVNSTSGKLSVDWDENAIVLASGGSINTPADCIQGNLYQQKGLIYDSLSIKPKFHWWQEGTTAFKITLEYRTQNPNTAKADTWSSVTYTIGDGNEVYSYSSGTLNQISHFDSMSITLNPAGIFQYRLARTDTQTGDMNLTGFGFVVRRERVGSTSEWS